MASDAKPTNPSNPYLNARREWDERYGDQIARAKSWRAAAFASLAVDGAIIHAQFESSPEETLQSLDRILKLLGPERNNQSQEPSEVKSIGR